MTPVYIIGPHVIYGLNDPPDFACLIYIHTYVQGLYGPFLICLPSCYTRPSTILRVCGQRERIELCASGRRKGEREREAVCVVCVLSVCVCSSDGRMVQEEPSGPGRSCPPKVRGPRS